MQATKKIWMNGKMVPWKAAQVHFLTHSLHYGSAVFEGIRCYSTKKGPAVFRLHEHIDRLLDSAKIVGMAVPFTHKQLFDACRKVVRENKLKECYIRPLAFYDYGKMGLNPIGAKVSVGIAAWPWGPYLGKDGVAKGIRVKISSFARHHPNVTMTKAKVTGNYANSILAKTEVVKAGYDEAIMLDTMGFVSECTGENLFLVKDGVLITPPLSTVLEGITRASLLEVAMDSGLEVVEERLTRDQLYVADEVFLCGTAAEVTPVREIDDRKVGKGKPGPVTKLLQKKYDEIIHGRDECYLDWLDLV